MVIFSASMSNNSVISNPFCSPISFPYNAFENEELFCFHFFAVKFHSFNMHDMDKSESLNKHEISHGFLKILYMKFDIYA